MEVALDDHHVSAPFLTMEVALDDHHVSAPLHDDVLVEILLYLSVKSLSRFRCVCKAWNKIVQTPLFVDAHLRKRRPHSLLIINNARKGERSFFAFLNAETLDKTLQSELPMRANRSNKLCVCGTSNGLVCISSSNLLNVDPIYIWNPSVRKTRKLPTSLIPRQDHHSPPEYLAFGFHQAVNDHMVVRIVRFDKYTCHYLVEVYSLNANCWRRIPAGTPIPSTLDCQLSPKSLCLNGFAHWIANHRNRGVPNSILCFDMATEEFHMRRLPDSLVYTDSSSPLFLGVVKESLSLFHCRPDSVNPQCDTWLLSMGSWMRFDTIGLPLHVKITRPWNLLDYELLLVKSNG